MYVIVAEYFQTIYLVPSFM